MGSRVRHRDQHAQPLRDFLRCAAGQFPAQLLGKCRVALFAIAAQGFGRASEARELVANLANGAIIDETPEASAIVPGVVGALAMVGALFGLSVLSVSWSGFALIVVGIALLVIDAHVPTHGVLTIGGLIALAILGSFAHFYLMYVSVAALMMVRGASRARRSSAQRGRRRRSRLVRLVARRASLRALPRGA